MITSTTQVNQFEGSVTTDMELHTSGRDAGPYSVYATNLCNHEGCMVNGCDFISSFSMARYAIMY